MIAARTPLGGQGPAAAGVRLVELRGAETTDFQKEVTGQCGIAPGGRTGLRVSELALGTANFGTRWATGADFDCAKRIFDMFVSAGGTFIDTADVYQFGESEQFLSELIRADRDSQRHVRASRTPRFGRTSARPVSGRST
ncbi:aldo/keto reductase [Mycobacterium paraintracellulare]|uniref:aldo/keto reductase n=1 Tax=Mycobacterium paraintracellulare TaxID=1138383 RepID=UPI001F4404EE|nr:aldo/keto reductase [Mycobacterium paraintracellulare]